MIINSPVGRFPLRVTGLELVGGTLKLDAEMGTWPSSVEIPLVELPRLTAQLLPIGRLAGVTGVVAVAMLVIRHAHREGTPGGSSPRVFS